MAKAEIVSGRTAKLLLSETIELDTIVSVQSTERDDTFAQSQRRNILDKALQNPERLIGIPFAQMIYVPTSPVDQIVWPQSNRKLLDEPIELDFDIKDLNDSQARIFFILVYRGYWVSEFFLIDGSCRPCFESREDYNDYWPSRHRYFFFALFCFKTKKTTTKMNHQQERPRSLLRLSSASSTALKTKRFGS
jgi:hypothetical protein